MTVKSLRKQLAAAIAMTLVATTALGSSTYAWFAINNKVVATGMSFSTQVSNNLFITTEEVALDSTQIKNDNAFGTTLVSTKSALLEPVSTISAKAAEFYYASTSNVKGSGDTVLDKWISYDSANRTAFNSNYGIQSPKDAFGYIDYVYNLKAINGSDGALELDLTKVEMLSNVASDPQTAFRVGVFVNTATGSGDNTADGKYNVTAAEATNYTNMSDETVTSASIFTVSGAKNFTTGDDTAYKAVALTEDASTTDKALKDVTYNAPIAIKVPAHSTQFYKVIVRVWLEGEDTTCNNTTFADLNKGTWAMSTEWNLGTAGAATAASNITLGMTAADPVDLDGLTVSSTATDYIEINGVVYKPVTGTNAPANLYVAVVGTETRAYLLTGNKLNPIDVTNMYKNIPSAQ